MMKKIFFFLLRKYSNTEAERMVIYKQLWNKVCADYSEQTAFGNVYNMNTEILLSNPVFNKFAKEENKEYLKMLEGVLAESFDDSVEFVKKEVRDNKLKKIL